MNETNSRPHFLTVWTSTNMTTWTQNTGATQTVNSTANNVQAAPEEGPAYAETTQ